MFGRHVALLGQRRHCAGQRCTLSLAACSGCVCSTGELTKTLLCFCWQPSQIDERQVWGGGEFVCVFVCVCVCVFVCVCASV